KAVRNQSWQLVCLAEDQPISVRPTHESVTICDGRADTLAHELRQVAHRLCRNQPDGDLRRAAVKCRAEKASSIVSDSHQPARCRATLDIAHVGLIDPGV